MTARKSYISGNWKMNLDRRGARELVVALREHVGSNQDVDVAVFPPAVYLEEVVRAVAGSPIRVGAQNCCDEASGAFTGEISVAMIKDVGATIALLGHSERRHLYGEGDELINRKVHIALDQGLDVFLCVGETREEREASQTEAVVRRQASVGLEGVSAEQMERITLAYEPVWAIGTGLTATPQQAGQVHAYLRGVLGGLYSDVLADSTRILYGGSVKADNAKELLSVPDIDGALVGGASLKVEAFAPIIDAG